MKSSESLGRVHSIQSLGTLDGPGVRFVVFMQGCCLRCGCCHNPDTWEMSGGLLYGVAELADKCARYREYFGEHGGITVSGGEPLLQADFVSELFSECKKRGINTCLDTSGCIIDKSTEKLLQHTDRVLLDIKYPTDEQYREYVGCSIEKPLEFLKLLEKAKIPTVLRQVVIPSLNDNDESLDFLAQLKTKHSCVENIELLPFKKLCAVKYDKLGIKFRFENIPEPSAKEVEAAQKELNK